jgi:hypothetical protein
LGDVLAGYCGATDIPKETCSLTLRCAVLVEAEGAGNARASTRRWSEGIFVPHLTEPLIADAQA